MKIYSGISACLAAMILIASGCGKPVKTVEEADTETSSLIQVSLKQFEAESMETGKVTLHYFTDEVTCNGYIAAPANGIAQISTPISGIVESIRCSMGDNVRKGQVMAMISSNELMIIQQDFAESSAILKKLKLDYERSKSLYEEKIGAEKDFIAIESEYKGMLTRYNSLKLRLQMLKLDVARIEAGDLYAEFPLISPINGYVTSQNMILGQFVEQQKNLVEIIDVNQLQLQLSVFENDISKLKNGQNVRFSALSETSATHTASLNSISKTINPESKTILCTARIINQGGLNLINRSFVEAHIQVDKKEANALPSEAVLKSGKEYYLFKVVKSDKQYYYLKKVKVEIGKISDGFTEIVGEQDFTDVLVKGAYNLSF